VLTLLGLMFVGVAVFVVFGLVALVFKLAIRLILLPLLLIKWLVGGIVLLIVGPILAVVGLVMLLLAGTMVFVPLLPFVLLAGLVWLILRLSRPALA
jgi:hypothetical protein